MIWVVLDSPFNGWHQRSQWHIVVLVLPTNLRIRWSLSLDAGILLYEMLFGRTPFRGKNRQRTFANILDKELYFPSNIPVSVPWCTLLESSRFNSRMLSLSGSRVTLCFCEVRSRSLTIFAKLQVSLEAKLLIRDLLNRDPTKRLGSQCGAHDIKNHPFFRDIKWSLVRNMVSTDANAPSCFMAMGVLISTFFSSLNLK